MKSNSIDISAILKQTIGHEEVANPAVTQAFLELAKDEFGHKARIEELFVNVGYPEVF